MTEIAGMDGSGKVVTKRTSIDESLDEPQADGIMHNWLISREPTLQFVHCSVGQVMGKIGDEPSAVSGADGILLVMEGLDLPMQVSF
jgi:hypothetical protein